MAYHTLYTLQSQHYSTHANNIVTKGFNPMALLGRTITVTLDMSKAFDTVNLHTLIGKLLQTGTPGTVIKSLRTTSRNAKPILLSETTSPYNVRLKRPITHPIF